MLCEHNRRKSDCKYCGLCFCQHNKKRVRCYECVFQPKKCPHNRQKQHCYDCKGSQIYKHNRRKSICKVLKLCIHNLQKNSCVECNINIYFV